MARLTLEITQLARPSQLRERLISSAHQLLEAEIAPRLLERLSRVPPPPARTWAKFPFASERQRRWWWAAGVKRGPYRRTGGILRWLTATRRLANGAELEATNPTPYAIYVYGPRQYWMHRGRWPDVKEVINAVGEDIHITIDYIQGSL